MAGPEIIPAILVKDEKEFRQKIEAVAGLVRTVQIDVMDGVFVPNATFADPARIEKMRLFETYELDYEVHLMVKDPLERLDAWSRSGCQRAILHVESVEDPLEAMRQVRAFGMEAGITLNPETPLEAVEAALPEADVVQVMGVHPGFMGQEFQPVAVEKVRELRDRWPDLVIEVDGGVSDVTVRRLADAGADRLVSGSYIFASGAPEKMIRKLEELTDYEEEV